MFVLENALIVENKNEPLQVNITLAGASFTQYLFL